MKPRPTKIQPGATLWNPNAGPDWYAKSLAGQWMYFDAEEGDWDNGQWVLSIGVKLADLIPVEELMAQPPEWNGEGLPPVGTECEVMLNRGAHGDPDWYRCAVVAHHWDRAVFYCAPRDGYYAATPAIIRPIKIKTEREIAIDDIKSLITKSCGLTEHRIKIIATALFDAGYRKVEK